MPQDNPIQRAAGAIFWHLQRNDPPDVAIAWVQKREPELTDSEMRQALRWAMAQMKLQQVCSCKECGGPLVRSPDSGLCCGKCGCVRETRLFRDALDEAGVPYEGGE